MKPGTHTDKTVILSGVEPARQTRGVSEIPRQARNDKTTIAEVAELVDARDLKSLAYITRRAGSTPALGTIMDQNQEFLEFIIDETNLDIQSRIMFSSLGLYLDGSFFGIIHDSVLYLKTSANTRAKFKDLGSTPFAPSKEQVLKNYMEVPAEIIEDREKLREWIEESAEL